jgi:hypothetical protein
VLNAIMNGSPFTVLWTSEDELGPTTEAYSSGGGAGFLYHYLSQANFDSPSSPNVRQWTCGSITATRGCTVNGGDFCLGCNAETSELQLCGDSS